MLFTDLPGSVGVAAGAIATWVQVFPTGDAQGRMVALHQPVTLSAMDGLFGSEKGAPSAQATYVGRTYAAGGASAPGAAPADPW